MNRGELRARVRSLANVYSTALLSDDEINTALSEANVEVAEQMQWPYLTEVTTVTTAAGDDSYALPADLYEVMQVTVRDGMRRVLSPATVFDADADASNDYSTAPLFYRSDPTGQLVLYPTPGGAEELTVVYLRRVTPLSSDTASPDMLDEFHPALAYKAAAQLLLDKRGDAKKVEVLAQTYASYIERMRKHYMITADHSPIRLALRRPRWVRWLG